MRLNASRKTGLVSTVSARALNVAMRSSLSGLLNLAALPSAYPPVCGQVLFCVAFAVADYLAVCSRPAQCCWVGWQFGWQGSLHRQSAVATLSLNACEREKKSRSAGCGASQSGLHDVKRHEGVT